jgi:hypothetical protein
MRGEDVGKSMSRYLVERVVAKENVELLSNNEVRRLRGRNASKG